MNMFLWDTRCDTLSHNVMCAQGWKCREKSLVRSVSVYTSHRLQWIAINCKRNQLWQKRDSSKKKFCELTSNSIRMRSTTRNLEMKANIAILYVGQVNSERWTGNLRRKLLVLVVCVSLAVSNTMGSAFLYHVIWDRDCIQSQYVPFSSRFAVNQALSAQVQYTNSLIPIKKTVRTLYLWCSFAQLE